MSDREELLKVMLDADEAHAPEGSMWTELADAILAAGYHKPRTITTTEELDALPEESVVKPQFGRTWRRGLVSWDNGIYRWSSESIAAHGALPATVLYEPEPTP